MQVTSPAPLNGPIPFSRRDGEEGIDIRFELGSLKLELVPAFLRNQPSKVTLYKDSGKDVGLFVSPRPDWSWAFKNEDDDFIRALSTSTTTRSMASDCLKDMKLIEQIWALTV